MKKKSANEIGAEVIEHWYTLIAAQQFSAKEFYQHIEAGLATQKVPGLKMSRIYLAEGGALSDNREYLRMKRERLTFDICAAPVGINYFFSYRFYVEPVVIEPFAVFALLVVLGLLLSLFAKFWGLYVGILVLALVCTLAVGFMRNAVGRGLSDVDATLSNLPVIGAIYERYFRKDSYYREDMRTAYCSIVSGLVKQEVASITGAKGVTLLREFTYSPVFQDLYRAKETATNAPAMSETASA